VVPLNTYYGGVRHPHLQIGGESGSWEEQLDKKSSPMAGACRGALNGEPVETKLVVELA
jgi:hypothetical protein